MDRRSVDVRHDGPVFPEAREKGIQAFVSVRKFLDTVSVVIGAMLGFLLVISSSRRKNDPGGRCLEARPPG